MFLWLSWNSKAFFFFKKKREIKTSPKATTQHITNLIHQQKLAATQHPDTPGLRLEGEEPRRLKNDSNNVVFISMRPHKGKINHCRVIQPPPHTALTTCPWKPVCGALNFTLGEALHETHGDWRPQVGVDQNQRSRTVSSCVSIVGTERLRFHRVWLWSWSKRTNHMSSKTHLEQHLTLENPRASHLSSVCCVIALIWLLSGSSAEMEKFSCSAATHTHTHIYTNTHKCKTTLQAVTAKEAILLLLQFHGDGWHLLA